MRLSLASVVTLFSICASASAEPIVVIENSYYAFTFGRDGSYQFTDEDEGDTRLQTGKFIPARDLVAVATVGQGLMRIATDTDGTSESEAVVNAFSKTLFNPVGNVFPLIFSGEVAVGHEYSVSLRDETTSTELFSETFTGPQGVLRDQYFPVDPMHAYLLTIEASGIGNADDNRSRLNVRLDTAVPLPPAVLGGLALFGVAGLRMLRRQI